MVLGSIMLGQYIMVVGVVVKEAVGGEEAQRGRDEGPSKTSVTFYYLKLGPTS
jgi:hypothetical protein